MNAMFTQGIIVKGDHRAAACMSLLRCRLHYSMFVPHLLNDNTASLSCVVAEYSLMTLSIAAGVTLQLSSMSIGGGHVVP